MAAEKRPKTSYSISDVARLSGTSLGTVSRVLNGHRSVSDETRSKVQRAIAALGYEPNAGARQMRSGRSKMIGIVLPSLTLPSFGILAAEMEKTLFDAGYHSLICNTRGQAEDERRYVANLIRQHVDGVLAVSAADDANFTRLAMTDIPIVAVDRSAGGREDLLITADHIEAGRLMADHLLSLGHRRIAILGAPADWGPIKQRVEGATKIMAEHGLAPVNIALAKSCSVAACARLATESITTQNPTAFLCTTDLAAIGALHAAHELGMSLPEDLSVMGFDNIPQSAYTSPPLTTVDMNVPLMGRLAAQEILSRIEPRKYQAPDVDVAALRLVARGSTAPPPPGPSLKN